MPKPVCAKPSAEEQAEKLHDTFTKFVGQTFYGQMMKSMRSTVGEAAYFNGGQGENPDEGDDPDGPAHDRFLRERGWGDNRPGCRDGSLPQTAGALLERNGRR